MLLLTAVFVLAGSAVAVTLIIKSHLEATSPTPLPGNVSTASLFASITKDGKPASGYLYVDNCDKSPIPSQGGDFSCTMSSKTDPNKVALGEMRFDDFSKVYSLPITTGDIPTLVQIPKGSSINLRVSIDSIGNLKLFQLINWDYVDITDSGIQI